MNSKAMGHKSSRSLPKDVTEMLLEAKAEPVIVTEEMLVSLPGPVQGWLRQARIIGKAMPRAFRVLQNGKMCIDRSGKWFRFKAEQYFILDPPAFIWNARVRLMPFLFISGKDRYQHGHGNMVIKFMNAFTMANESGKEIDQGSLVRYLAEMSWFPHAAVSPLLKWEEMGNYSARVTMTWKGVEASGIYTFDHQYRISGFEALRYMESKGVFSKETWSIAVTGYKEIGGVQVGSRSEVTWKLKDGDFTWLALEITNIQEA